MHKKEPLLRNFLTVALLENKKTVVSAANNCWFNYLANLVKRDLSRAALLALINPFDLA